MFDSKQLLDQFLGTGASSNAGNAMQKGQDYLKNNAGGLAGGALAGGLAGILLGSKKGRKLGKKAVTYGGMALVGGLAFKAFQTWQQNKNVPVGGDAAEPARQQPAEPIALPSPTGTAFDPVQQPGGEAEFALQLIVAMIQAAKADGHIDADEQTRIFDRIDELGLDTEAKAFVMDELRAPLDIERVVQAATSQEAAVELYAASRLAIDPDLPAEKAYLMMLAARLELDPALTAEIDRAIEAEQQV